MAHGLDELIDGLVADIAYAGETGLSVSSFIATVTSKLRPQKKKESAKDSNGEAQSNGVSLADQGGPLADTPGVQLARKAWTWLADRPEILIGRDGSQKHLSLDEALSLPEPQPLVEEEPANDADGPKKGTAPAGPASGRKKTASAGDARKSTINAAVPADPTIRPRLYATERTIWNTVTGHDVDYKKVPPLEWKCLMGIASARERGILQADLRALVNQDKRSVPKRTDFLAAKGYIVKRAILTRGNRTSILWLTDFAPIELHDGDDSKPSKSTSKKSSKAAPETDVAASVSSSKELASSAGGGSPASVDFSTAFLTKDLEPVPWRSRWMGDSIEFSSFGQTILAVVKAWSVIRVIDLKQKLGIQGMRWQMRTLSRICREFVACGVLRFVAAVRRDEKRLFKDCMKFEREPTNNEWTMILASGRKRAPLTELLATQKKLRQQNQARAAGQLDDPILDEDMDDEGEEGGVGLAASTTVIPTWVPEVPLANQVFDFVQKSGPAGTTAPAVTRTTIGPSFGRYVFSLLTDLAKPRTQPPDLTHFQLVSEPTRVGRNNSYKFKAPGGPELAESISLAASPGDLVNAPASQTSQFFSFSTPTGPLAQQDQVPSLSESAHSAVMQHPAFLRRQRGWVPTTRGRGRPAGRPARRHVQVQNEEERGATEEAEANDREKVQGVEVALVVVNTNRDAESPVVAPEPPRKRRGRPPKNKAVKSVPEPQTQSGEGNAANSREASAGPRPLVAIGVPGSLGKAKTLGRPRKSLVLDFSIPKLKDSQLLSSGRGYKDGVPTTASRIGTPGSKGEDDGGKDEEDLNEEEASENGPRSKLPSPDNAVAAAYQGSPGRLTLDREKEQLHFTFDIGSEPSKEPLAIPVVNIVNEPSMREVPGGGGQAIVFEAREWGESDQQAPEATWPFVFVLDLEAPGNSAYVATLLSAVVDVARQLKNTTEVSVAEDEHEKAQNEEEEDEGATPSSSAPAPSQPPKTSGRRGGGARRGRKKTYKDVQEFVCEKCDGRWKNLVGLRYHQRKSQTSCNPDYVPPALPTLPSTSRVWKNERRTDIYTPAMPSNATPSIPQQLPDLSRRRFVSTAGNSRPASRPPSSHHVDPTPAPTATQTPSEAPAEGSPSQKRVAEDPKGENAPGDAKRQKTGDDTEASNVVEEPERIRTPPALRTILLSSTATAAVPRSMSNDAARQAASANNTPRMASAHGFKMPTGASNVNKNKTKFMVRSQRVIEIIKHLVDRFDGVFPGDRSLWYAVFGVYTRSFPSEEPPTFNVCKTAVKRMDTVKELEEHTFGFRDAKGLFNYCRLVARPGVDILQSESAKDFKNRLQQNFPQPYVPAEYAPTDKDLAVLRLWDREGMVDDVKRARAKRGRRSLAPEIEVLNAPFYEKPSIQRQARASANGPLLIEYGSDDGEGDHDRRRHRGLNRHHSSGGSGGHDGAKRRKVARFADYIAGNDDDVSDDDVYDGVFGDHDGFDNEYNIDPALRTRRPQRNPGLNSLPATFFPPGSRYGGLKTARVPKQPSFADCLSTFIFDQPDGVPKDDTGLAGDIAKDDDDDSDDDADDGGNDIEEEILPSTAEDLSRLAQHTFVTKLVVLQDDGSAPGAWPVLTQTYFQKVAPASFTMDGLMPSRKDLLRENLPRSVDDCVEMLRGNQKLPPVDDTPMGKFWFDVECCRYWELSQRGTQILYNASVAPEFVFLNMAFPGEHYTAERDKDELAEAEAAERAEAEAEKAATAVDVLPTSAVWDSGNQFTVESLPYRSLEDPDDVAGGALEITSPQRGRGRGRGGHQSRPGPLRPAKYVLRSRREMTAYPQKPEDYIRKEAAEDISNVVVVEGDNNSSRVEEDVDWKAENTRIAAFVAIKTLVGGLSQSMDWGLLMRLFPDWKLSALRLFWTSIRKQRPAYLDQLTERFQQSFLEAYTNKELPALDFDHVVEYDWPRLIAWTVRLMRREAVHAVLPATREHLAQTYDIVGQPLRMVGWREEYFHSARSMWNRLQDSASEAAALPLDAGPPATPAEAMAAQAQTGADSTFPDAARRMVARSWIRALCATPHDRYPPSRIKQKLLTLGAGLGGKGASSSTSTSDEAAANRLLQTVIAELQNERVLRRSKSMVALGGRMYVLAEAYGNTLEKVAQQDKFRQAWAFKAELDACFRQGGSDAAYEIPLTMNDDGMVMALINLQAHGRVTVQAIDAPHVPFGFEPGNYETRKFPKHYQRFRQRIVPTERYVYNDDAELATLVQRARAAVDAELNRESETVVESEASSPASFPPREMPVWRDFFGVLDRGRFAKLASAVVFSQATRGATPLKQTAAHMRPVLEPFEAQLLMDWATAAGILAKSELPGGGGGSACSAEDPVGRTVSEWWWLLTGQVYMELWAEEAKEKERAKEREKWQSVVISAGATREDGAEAAVEAMEVDDVSEEEEDEDKAEDGPEDGAEDEVMAGALP